MHHVSQLTKTNHVEWHGSFSPIVIRCVAFWLHWGRNTQSYAAIPLYVHLFSSSTDSEGVEVDILTPFDSDLKPAKMEKEKTIVNVSEKKKAESNNISTCEFKSARQLRYENRQKSTCTKAFNIQISQSSEKCVANKALNLNQDIASPHSSGDDAETDYFSDGDVSATPLNYLQNCIQQMTESNLVKSVLRKCEEKGLTRHFMALMEGLANGKLPVTNMPFLLALEFALLQSLENTTQMRYCEDMTLFREIALSIGGSRLLRLFALDKHFGQVNSGKSKQSKYSTKDGSYNFAVPDERILQKSKTNIPKDIPCGVIDEALNLLVPEKEYILSLDGKQVGQG